MGTGILALTLLFVAVNALPSLKLQRGIYGQFQKKYGRTFASKAEEDLRFDVFSKRLQRIEELNKLHKAEGVTFGISKFTDWTDAERARYTSQRKPEKNLSYPVKVVNKPALPTEFDWRANGGVTPVKDMRSDECESSWAFAASAVLESQYLIKNKENLDLSEQQLIDCVALSWGCDGGWYDHAFNYVKKNGQLKESDDPYQAKETGVCPSQAGYAQIKDIWQVAKEADSIASYIVDYGPVAIYFGSPNDLFDYKSGVYSPTQEQCDDENINAYNSGVLVGFGEEGGKKYWIVRTSWGESFGDKGYFKLLRGSNACGVESFPVGATL